MSSTICFVDLDHTLFNSHDLFLDAQNFFRGLFGVDEVAWAESYAAVRWPKLYSIDAHAKEIQKRLPEFPVTAAVEKFYHIFTDLKPYLYPDTIPFLESAAARGFSVCLLSHGDSAFQKYKVNASRIADYFDDFFFTNREGAKYVHIEEAMPLYSRIMYVDDNVMELDIAKRVVESCETYFIHRLPGVHDASVAAKHRICHTLADVFGI